MTKPLSVIVVLDRSGSMENTRDKTIGGFNEFVNGLRIDAQRTEVPTELTLMLFDDGKVDTIYRGRSIGEVPSLNRETYIPRGSTNLLDAVGEAIHGASWIPKDHSIAIAIMTDGEENSSCRYNIGEIRQKISALTEQGVLVSYVGANQDAWKVGANYGIRAQNTMTFNEHAINNVFAATAASYTRYKNVGGGIQGLGASAFNQAEVDAALDPNKKIS